MAGTRHPRRAQARVAAVLATLGASSCSGGPLPLVKAPAADVAPASPVGAPLSARWIDAGGATAVGPTLPEGTLVLLGGRRALVAKDGSVRSEAAPSPEPLGEIIEVPTSQGSRLVARSASTLYRLPNPLGAPVPFVRMSVPIARVGAFPGIVAVWTARSDVPRFVDVETGLAKAMTGLPNPPLRAVTFVDAKRGAAVFAASGVAVTNDGGATWKTVSDAGLGEAQRATGLRRRGQEVRAFAFSDGPEAEVDLARSALGRLVTLQPSAGEPALLRWIRATGRDPLEVAAGSGIDMQGNGALVASHGLFARVDLKTGLLLELTQFATGKWMNPCSAGRSGVSAFVACSLSEGEGELFDPFGVLRVGLGEVPIKVDRPVLVRNGEAELRSSPSGGVLLIGPCIGDDEGDVCVKQPSGKWLTLKSDLELADRGVGPLADGRVAFFRGLHDGEPAMKGDPDESSAQRARIVALDAKGNETLFAPIASEPRKDFRVESAIEEDEGRALHAVLTDGEAAHMIIALPGKDASEPRKIEGVRVARVHAGRGIAFGEGRVMASLDGGASWNKVEAPQAILEGISQAWGSLDEPHFVGVSEVGVRVGSILRIGWGPPVPQAERTLQEPPVFPEPSKPPLSGNDRVLVCKTDGASQSPGPLLGSAQIKALLGTRPATPDTKREVVAHAGVRWGMLDTVALLEEEGRTKRGEPQEPGRSGVLPTTWALRWHDPLEIGGRVRSWTGPSPKSVSTFGSALRSANASGGRALFTVKNQSKHFLVRVRPAGSETVEVPAELLPSPGSDVVFGSEQGEPIAWMHETSVVVWFIGEAPRALAHVAPSASRQLGEPTKEGLPIFVGAGAFGLLRLVPLGPTKREDKPPPPQPLAITGWSKVAPLGADVNKLPPCAGRPKGARIWVSRGLGRMVVDGVNESVSLAVYDVRVSAGEACIAGISALLTPERGAQPAPPQPGTKNAGPGPAAFVRADLLQKRAEGGDRGVPPAVVRRLSCSLPQ